MARTNPRGTSSPSAWALPRIVIRMFARLRGIVHGEGDGHVRSEELGVLDVPGRAADAGFQLSPLLLERLPFRRLRRSWSSPLPCL